jgi:hypothetical protein
MARSAKPGSQDLIGRISDTIADHPRVSAAAAFQMGVLLGQAMQNTGALKDIGRKMAAAPAALASSIPTFGLFESDASDKSRKSHSKKPRTPSGRTSARRGSAKRSRRAARA